ncbi:hypothetical protein ACER0A_003325 [Haloimpatiens sp. FM7315]|uniref:hypothetical protein n=1 Tax=Haloimpatiens sp. FM7315 TaxID=3298609 RepID=UPI00370BC5FF
MNGYSFVVLSFIIESSWQIISNIFVKGKVSKDRLGALIIGLIIVFSANVDITELIGIHMKYGVGKILTALLISRGSNFTHDFISILSTEYQKRK